MAFRRQTVPWFWSLRPTCWFLFLCRGAKRNDDLARFAFEQKQIPPPLPELSSLWPLCSLWQFNDYVLYRKHNPNAQAVASLEGEATNIQNEIARLIEQMNQSIARADEFIKTLP